ncbi:uncharacterized protein BJ212DRAFT_1302834 [Suillus subaureus]|uniref:Uncharacterized protein n=1 Tax=Suillus subaureus TaxID=48587 RepID=A0A9P7E2B8_9AGAM|nr:uncharacterized protein BJ212DRAFT_1302834 [Suillus subaureus]KAG1808941.1 hypothetical protein BJ212DRAFT_1302834 [Suillus subaureus]
MEKVKKEGSLSKNDKDDLSKQMEKVEEEGSLSKNNKVNSSKQMEKVEEEVQTMPKGQMVLMNVQGGLSSLNDEAADPELWLEKKLRFPREQQTTSEVEGIISQDSESCQCYPAPICISNCHALVLEDGTASLEVWHRLVPQGFVH